MSDFPQQLSLGDGRYRLDGRLGAGGMAVVYRLTHTTLGTPYALKVIREPSASGRSRLLREGRAQASLRHPNLVSVVDVVQVQGMPALVVEYVDGPALDLVLARRRLSVDQADWIARALLDGMVEAHRNGFVHRDLKPANVLIDVAANPTPRVTDFGLVKQVDTEVDLTAGTRTGAVLGTPAYMAPEQIRDASKVDARADVFALAAVLYELLAGKRAFEGNDSFALFESIVYGRYERLPDTVPARMKRAIEAALQGDREVRVPTVAALRELWLEGAPPLDPAEVWDVEVLTWMRTLRPLVEPVDGSLAASWAPVSDSQERAASPTARPGADDARVVRLGLLGGLAAGAALFMSLMGGRDVEWMAPVGAALGLFPMLATPAWAARSGVGSPLRLGALTGLVLGSTAWLVSFGPVSLMSTLKAPRAARVVGEGAPLEALRTGFVADEGALAQAAAQVLSMASVDGTTSFWTTVSFATLVGVVAGLFGGLRREAEVASAPWHPVIAGWLGLALQAAVLSVTVWAAGHLPDHERSLLAVVWALGLSLGPILLAASMLSVASLGADLRAGARRRALVGLLLVAALQIGAVIAVDGASTPVPVFVRVAVIGCVPVWLVGLPWAWLSRNRPGVVAADLDRGQRWAAVSLAGLVAVCVWLGAGGGLRAVAMAFVDAEGYRDPALTVQVGSQTFWAAAARTWGLAALTAGSVSFAAGLGLVISGWRGLPWSSRSSMVLLPLAAAGFGALQLGGDVSIDRPVVRVRVGHEASILWPVGASGAVVDEQAVASLHGTLEQPYMRVRGLQEGRAELTFERAGEVPVVYDVQVQKADRDPPHALYVEEGMVALLPMPPGLAAVTVGDPEVVQAMVLRRDLIELRVKSAGRTVFSIVDQQGHSLGWDVVAYPHDSGEEYPSPHVAEVDCCRTVRVALGGEAAVALPARPRAQRMNDTSIAGVRFLEQREADDGIDRPVMAAIQGLALGRTMLVVESQSQVPAIYEIEVYDQARSVVVGVGYATVVARSELEVVHPDVAKVMPLEDGLFAVVGLAPGLTTLRSRGADGEVREEPVVVGLEEKPPPHLVEVLCCTQVDGVQGESTVIELPVWAQRVHVADDTIAAFAIGEVADGGSRTRMTTMKGLRYGRTSAVVTGRGQPPLVLNVEVAAIP